MRKFKIFVDMDKEEQYLNKMAKNGYILKNYSSFGVYTFVKSEPKDLHYRIDYRVFNKKREFEEYKTLFEDAGWEHISGTTYSGGQYFLPKSENADLSDIFSDVESKSARYKRFVDQCIGVFMCMLVYIAIILGSCGFNFNNLGYLTPGLWEKTGIAFWRAFIFETPFVVLRFLPFILFMVLTVVYGYWAFEAQKLYKKSLRDNKM